MKNTTLYGPMLLASLLLGGCGDSGNPLIEGGGASSSSSNTISQQNLTLATDNINPEFIIATYDPGTPTNILSIDGQIIGSPATFTVFGADRSSSITSGNSVEFRTDYGAIESSCSLASGSCSVTLTTAIAGTFPPITTATIAGVANTQTVFVTVIGYTLGEESFTDNNANGFFDDEDTFSVTTQDITEPFIDSNRNDVYDAGEIFIDVNSDGSFTGGDGLYSGSDCQHSSLCSPSPSITIWDSIAVDQISTGT